MPAFKFKKIRADKNLGEILRSARLKKKISLDQAEEETKVRVKYLEALEQGHYEALPSDVYAQGFLTKYVDFLELDKTEMLNRFKAERGNVSHNSGFLPVARLRQSRFYFTPRTLVVIGVALVLVGVLGYIIYSVRSFTLPPNLQISSPTGGEILKEDTVNIIGKTDVGVNLKINNQTVMLDDNGNFNQEVKLNPGLNTFEVQVTNRLKKNTVKEVQILAQY